jgi:hypothetical protein
MTRMFIHPMPGQVVMRVANLEGEPYTGSDEERRVVERLDQANVLTSLVEDRRPMEDRGPFDEAMHKPVLDIDLPVRWIPSSTEGHGHLIIDKAMPWTQYKAFLRACEAADLLEPGYVDASIEREHTSVRLPWIKKGGGDTPPAESAVAPLPPLEDDVDLAEPSLAGF